MTVDEPNSCRKLRRHPVQMSLDDGRTVTVRPMTSADAGSLGDALLRVPADVLYRRFMGATPSLKLLVARAAESPGGARFVLGAFHGTVLVAVAEWVRMDEENAEFAIALDPEWQRVGLARRLTALVVDDARDRGFHVLVAESLGGNTRIRELIRATGLPTTTHVSAGLVTTRIHLGAPGSVAPG
jgi:GNAT superfamily N-acetyltransferase